MNDKSSNNTELQAPEPASIKLETLLPVIQGAYGEQITEINQWTCAQLSSGIGGGAIYRYSGQGQVLGKSINWSIILKIIKPSAKGWEDSNSSDWSYYKREMDAYRSGWLGDLPGGIAAPQYLGATEFRDGTCWLWLEDIRDRREHWTLEDYGKAARDIGQFNGAYLAGVPLPSYPWLSLNWIRGYVSLSAPAIEPLRNALDHPLIRRWFPGNRSDLFFLKWSQRQEHFRVMDQLPQTMCHFDLFRRNLFLGNNADDCGRTIAIDWAFVGPGCIGADISPLVIATLAFFEMGLDKTRELDRIVFNEYLEGLHQAGWQGDPRQPRLGYLTANIRYWFPEIGALLTAVFDDHVRNMVEQSLGHPLGDIFDYWAAMWNELSFLEDERSQLMNEMGFR